MQRSVCNAIEAMVIESETNYATTLEKFCLEYAKQGMKTTCMSIM